MKDVSARSPSVAALMVFLILGILLGALITLAGIAIDQALSGERLHGSVGILLWGIPFFVAWILGLPTSTPFLALWGGLIYGLVWAMCGAIFCGIRGFLRLGR